MWGKLVDPTAGQLSLPGSPRPWGRGQCGDKVPVGFANSQLYCI